MKTDVRTSQDRRLTVPASTAADAPTSLDYAGIAMLGVVIAIHTSELSGKTEEVAYLGFGYVLLIAASLISIVLLARRDVRGWILGGITCAATIVGFVLTRTTGLPKADDDIGNWSETIAIWALVAESAMVVLSVLAVSRHRRD
jgi:predicted membrane channel-forming protein YqfA (hemolysin III family)